MTTKVGWPRRFGRYVWNTLRSDKMPVWLTLFTLVASVAVTGFATYRLAPKLNAKFEAEKIRSAYVIDNLKILNLQTAELLSVIGDYNRQVMKDQKPQPDMRADVEKRITSLQWRIIEYDIIFDDDSSKKVLRSYKSSLEELRRKILAAHDTDSVGDVLAAAKPFARDSYAIVRLLSKRAEIKVDINPLE